MEWQLNFEDMRARRSQLRDAFTVIELLLTIAVISILAALIFPAINSSKARAKRTVCLGNIRQINLGMRLYWDDNFDYPPGKKNSPESPYAYWTGYKTLMKGYVGLHGDSSQSDKLFACPSDAYYYDFFEKTNHPFLVKLSFHNQRVSDYSSYFSNAGAPNAASNAPGLKGQMSASIKNPARSVLVGEMPAFFPYSWHEPNRFHNESSQFLTFNNARNVIGFADGHVDYVKIFWNRSLAASGGFSFSMNYDPPAAYNYQWSGD